MSDADATLMAHTFAKTVARVAEFAVELAESLHKDLGIEYSGPSSSKAKVVSKKRSRADKDPNEPKRPATAYMLYSAHIREEMKKKGEAQPQMKDLGEMWNKLEESEKEKFNTEAQQLKEQNDRQMAEYKSGKGVSGNGASAKSDESDSDSEYNGDVAPPAKISH
jgi:poly(A) polymerase Pap1